MVGDGDGKEEVVVVGGCGYLRLRTGGGGGGSYYLSCSNRGSAGSSVEVPEQ